ncbi:uncharacterized protein LOC128208495 [Mya arenaria]|uniref:uncharacterized protein LOC128208495 n=1 Tax=Mya arenaria TaxID=6604 RepID=UPI0022E2A5A4|nr:uncharacterized protein LOC128208495 [Mya arenaria]
MEVLEKLEKGATEVENRLQEYEEVIKGHIITHTLCLNLVLETLKHGYWQIIRPIWKLTVTEKQMAMLPFVSKEGLSKYTTPLQIDQTEKQQSTTIKCLRRQLKTAKRSIFVSRYDSNALDLLPS